MKAIDQFTPNRSEAGRVISPKLHERLSSGQVVFDLLNKNAKDRENAEDYIAERFLKEHGANLMHFMPNLISMKCDESFSAAIGLRNAGKERLFLEQYLDRTVEQQISQIFQQPVARDDVIEIGNLVSSRRGSSYLLFVIVAAILYEAGYRWVICTATSQVQHIIKKLKIESDVVCMADVCKLEDGQDQWGAYYSRNPQVMVGDIHKAYKVMSKNPLFKAMISPYQMMISDIAMKIVESSYE